MSKQPRDDSNYPIPVLSYRYNTGQQIPLTGTSSLSASFARHTRVVSIYATGDCFFEIGAANVLANLNTSHFEKTRTLKYTKEMLQEQLQLLVAQLLHKFQLVQ